MALSFPREMPNYRLTECSFVLDDNVAIVASGRGSLLNRTQRDDPSWRATIVTVALSPADRAVWSAWKKSLRGLNAMIAYDFDRQTPLAYPLATAPSDILSGWNGTATVTSIGGAALGLSGLPATYHVRAGDRIGLEQGGYRGYYEVLENVNASAGIATLTVAPFLHGVFSTAATARLWRPLCKFVLNWTTWREQALRDPSAISFEAMQLL